MATDSGRVLDAIGKMPLVWSCFAGTSTGANIVAALRAAEPLGSGATVATIVVDLGLRYLSGDVFRPEATRR